MSVAKGHRHRARPSRRESVSLFGLRDVRDLDGVAFGCPSGKIGYASKARAKRALKEAQRNGRGHVAVYECPHCPGWHTTSKVQG